MKSPIFIFSLPRAGSTLLQRILMSHPQIKSVAEPWLLLPLIYSGKKEGTLTEYSHKLANLALEDFISTLPKGKESYNEALSQFVNSLYAQQCTENELYFLDKTPRYYTIIPEIVEVFPDAKFIFLLRNPVHIYSSILNTWCGERLKYQYFYDIDLEYGPKALSDGVSLLEGKAYILNYESLVEQPNHYIKEICDYLNIEYSDTMYQDFFKQEIVGTMGDPTGVKEYHIVSKASLEKWKLTFKSRFRQRILKKYVCGLGKDILEKQGYSQDEIIKEIDTIETEFSWSIQDRIDYFRSRMVKKFKLNLLMKRKYKWFQQTSVS
jgi:hypothetical protein